MPKGRLEENLRLNPQLSQKIVLSQCFVSSREETQPELVAYASWHLDAQPGQGLHPVHKGMPRPTDQVPAITLDGFVERQGLSRIDLIKIDTDGHEYDVLLGAQEILRRFKPQIIFELGQYVMEERGLGFEQYLAYFQALGYELFDAANKKSISAGNWATRVPRFSTIDVLALPLR
ncbi:MAG: FkbM family methyltransferase [Cytophagales bacterium]|nr:FkbM family methyltransferase [Cytophagales bacterium]